MNLSILIKLSSNILTNLCVVLFSQFATFKILGGHGGLFYLTEYVAFVCVCVCIYVYVFVCAGVSTHVCVLFLLSVE